MEQNTPPPTDFNYQPVTDQEKSDVLDRIATEQIDRYRIALEATGIGTWDLDLLTNTVYWDDLCKELYGFHKDDVVPYDMVLSYMHPEDAPKVDAAVKASLNAAEKAPYDITFRIIGADDHQLRWLHCKGLTKFNEAGQPVRFTGTAQDVTRQQQQQEMLEASEARYRDLIENSPVGKVIFTGRDMTVDMINDTMLDIWGKDRSVIGKTLMQAMPELEGQPFLAQLQEVYDTGIPFSVEEGIAYLAKYGSQPTPHWFQYSYRALYDTDGRIHGIINTATEITSVVQTKQTAKETSEELLFILDAARLGTWNLDIRIGKLFFDERAKELFGYSTSGSIDLPDAFAAIYDEDRNMVSRAVDNAYNINYSDGLFDVEQRTKDGSIWLRVKGKATFDGAGNPKQLSGIVIDITPQKELQTVKDDFIKMAGHELKTPLTSAIAYAQIFEAEIQKGNFTKAPMLAARLKAQVIRVDNLVKDLLDVSKMKTGRLNYNEAHFPFDELVESAIEEIQITTKTHQIEKHLFVPGTVYGDKERIRQVIINLITNAIKYSPGAKMVVVNTNLKNSEVVLCVEDFGIGIPKEKQARVFEQFYRVGKDQKVFAGLGLGLYISSQIIQNTDGRIWISASEEGRGSTFCFALPCDYRTNLVK